MLLNKISQTEEEKTIDRRYNYGEKDDYFFMTTTIIIMVMIVTMNIKVVMMFMM